VFVEAGASASPPDDATDLAATGTAREMLELPETVFFSRLDDRVRRAELLLVLLRTGGLSRATAARALRAQLEAIRHGATHLGAPQLVALLDVLGDAVAELGDLSRTRPENAPRDVLVLDEDEVSRDLVALAFESHGQIIRCASSFDEFVVLFGERRPDLVVTDAELATAPPRYFCATLRELVGDVPIALFTTRQLAEIDLVARAAGAACCVPKEHGVEALLTALRPFLSAT
jgi:CheY-like chemotaxis protein